MNKKKLDALRDAAKQKESRNIMAKYNKFMNSRNCLLELETEGIEDNDPMETQDTVLLNPSSSNTLESNDSNLNG